MDKKEYKNLNMETIYFDNEDVVTYSVLEANQAGVDGEEAANAGRTMY